MSIVYQMTSTSSAKTTAAQTAGTGSKGAIAGSGDFLQTLAQSLNGGATTDNSSAAAGSLAANPLVFTFASSEDGEQTSITDILSSLFADLDSLDEALENDPSLLGDLQSLIQQMYAQLDANSGIQAEGSDEPAIGSETSNAASAIDLAEHPAAMRFVIQDVLTQLIAGMNEPDSTVVKNAPEFKHLLQSLQSQLQDAGVDTSLNKGWDELKSILETLAVAKVQAVQMAPTNQTSKQDSVASQVLVSAASNTGPKVSVETDSAPTTNEVGEVDHSSIITAGELSLRSTGTSAGKPAEPVMQASQFAKEMTQFVVNKLDIVQQKGFSEATISLRPEHLGKLDVQITLQNGQLVARFMTEHTMAKDMLEQQMMQLRSSLQAQGI